MKGQAANVNPDALKYAVRTGRDVVVHFMHQGQTPCGMLGFPKDWPAGHFWESGWPLVTCKKCLAAKRAKDGK